MVFRGHISMLNGKACPCMLSHDFPWQYAGNSDKFLMKIWAHAEINDYLFDDK